MAVSTRRAGGIAALAVCISVAVWPSMAAADLQVTDARIDGVTSTSSPPGGVLKATVTGRATGADTWRGTTYRFGDQSRCVDTSDTSSSKTVSFNTTAPGDPGNYDAGFTARGSNSCGGAQSAERVLTNALRVTTPGPNPNLPPRCAGINVMLVLDESGSIGDTPGAERAVKDATTAFLDSLSGTGAAVSITDFSSTARQQVAYTDVTPESIANVFIPYLNTGYNPGGWTNWEDAFTKVRQANADQRLADLVVFITDGDPTAHNNPSGGPTTGLDGGAVAALRPAAAQADLVKSQGSHVFALGVGEAVTSANSARRLTAISGFDQYPAHNFSVADYTLVEDFDELAEALREIASQLCESSVTITKLVDEGDGEYVPDEGWKFTARVTTRPDDYKWIKPPTGRPLSRSARTDDNGVASFQWKPANPTATSTVKIREALKPGFDFVDAVCQTNAPSGKHRRTIRRKRTRIRPPTLRPGEFAVCTVRNKIRPGTIEIEKSANPESAKEFPFSGSLGDFTLVDDGNDDAAASRTFSDLAPGTYTVSELVPEDWELTGVVCTPPEAVAIAGADAVITLAAEASVVCTYSDTRTDPPIPPEPPPGPTPTPPPTTELEVVKTAPRVTRVGRTIRFTLSVTNTGSVPATHVRLADVPPAALSLVAFTSSSQAKTVRGNAVWNLGTLAPGETRTVRGSARIAAGTPGLKRNLAIATAVNAKLAGALADTRLIGSGVLSQRRRQAPPVTG